MAGPGRQGWRTLKLICVTFLMVGLTTKECSGSEELLKNVGKILRDVPEVILELKKAAKSALLPVFQTRESRAQDRDDTNVDPSKTFCYGELGCISITKDFYHPIYRPINLEPASREEVFVNFRITSREDPLGVVVLGMDVRQALKSSFKPSRKTKFVIHGFLNGRDMPFLETIPGEFLRHYDVNVIWVDWTEGSIASYNRAVANTRVTGLEVAHFVNWLTDNMGLIPEDVHLIGHSLGAHICGYAGERIPRLGRITGLDPAEPLFQFLPPSVRLDPSDAIFVDVIHTDSESILNIGQGFGLRQPIGHLDFYPNDGLRQPGCSPPLAAPFRWLRTGFNFSKVWHAVIDTFGCNHIRAPLLFADSIGSECPNMAFRCDSYIQYISGECFTCGADGSRCAPMGLHADAWSGVGSQQKGLQLYVSTGGNSPFCRYHYQVTVEVGDLQGTGWERMGSLYVGFVTRNGRRLDFDLTSGRSNMFSSKGKYNFFMEHEEDIGDSHEVIVKWVMSHRGSRSLQESLSLTSVSVRNVDTSFIRGRSGRFVGSSNTISFCNDRRRSIVIHNQEVVTLKASANCSSTS